MRTVVGATFALLTLLGTGCGPSGRNGEDPLVIGAILPLSGVDAPFGAEVLAGMEMRAATETALRVDVVAVDGAGEAIASARRLEALVSDPRVTVLVGGWRAAVARPLAALAHARQVPLLTLSPVSTPPAPHDATTIPLHRVEALAVAASTWAVKTRGAGAAGVVADVASETSSRMKAAFERDFAARGGRIVWTLGLDAEGRPEGASPSGEPVDVVFVAASGEVAAEVARTEPRLARAAFVRTEGWGADEAASGLPESYLVAFHWFGEERGATVAFVRACEASGVAPTTARAEGWDAIHALVAAATEGGLTREGVDHALRNGDPIRGVGGHLALRGAAETPVVLRVTPGGYERVGRFAAPFPPTAPPVPQ